MFINAHIATASLSYDPATPLEIIEGTIAIKSAAYKPASGLFVASTVKRYVDMH